MKNIIQDYKARIHKINKLKAKLIDLEKLHGSPLYLYDKEEVIQNYKAFVESFKTEGINIKVFYACKSNPYQGLLNTVVEQGGSIDVSSISELKKAIEAKSKEIIFTGPTKSEEDFKTIIKCSKKVIINLESERELEILGRVCKEYKKKIKCGVRITIPSIHNKWIKFGIPISELRSFYDKAVKCNSIDFCGIHFHISWNTTSEKYVKCLNEIGNYIKKYFTKKERSIFKYIDIGGGFYYKPFEATYSWNEAQNMSYENDIVNIDQILSDKITPRYKKIEIDPINNFAKDISSIFNTKIKPLMPNVELFAEPGRLICNSSMHFLFKAIEIKKSNVCIANGGNYMIGWERFQYFNYSPIFNLSQYDDNNEIPFLVYGSLCTADDIWGYYVFSKGKIKEGDILLMPYKGAYDYTLAQNFIREIPQVIDL